MRIPKNNNDPLGLEFEIALMKARYVYPAPENTNIHSDDILGHAKQIYESLKNKVFEIKKLTLIRDPAGIKPLYCARTNEGWLFASQYDQI